MASLLIIGGSGFFGKSILDAYKRGLLDQWEIDSISIVARNSTRLRHNFSGLIDKSIRLFDRDISTCLEVPTADYVIHAAASTDASRYLERPEVEKANVLGAVRNYANLAQKYHRNSKILYVSSGAIYGVQPHYLSNIPEDFSYGDIENLDLTKRNYAAAKKDSEKIIEELGSLGLNVSIARCFAFIGKYLPRDKHFAIGNFIEDGLNGRAIRINAAHRVYRSYMYADELVEWLMTILCLSDNTCPTYNVGSDQSVEIFEVARKVAKIFGVEVSATLHNASEEDDRYVPSIQKACIQAGVLLNFNLDQSLKLTVNRILSNE